MSETAYNVIAPELAIAAPGTISPRANTVFLIVEGRSPS